MIGANGALVGFGGGLETKVWLLDHEALRTGRVQAKTRWRFLSDTKSAVRLLRFFYVFLY